MEVVGQRFNFDDSGAEYVCVARCNEYVNFRIKMSLRFTQFTFIQLHIHYN